MNILLTECMSILGAESAVASERESQQILECVQNGFLFSAAGRLLKGVMGECEKVDVEMALGAFDPDERVALFWDDARVPIVFTSLRRIRDGLFDVLAVGFYAYIYSKERGFLMELTGSGRAVVCKNKSSGGE